MSAAARATGQPLLSGLRALELGNSVGVAFCGKLLAEMGLEVAMVEPPEGHPLRRAAPRARLGDGSEASALFLYLAAGKESVALDRGSAAGAAALRELVAGADLVIHDLTDRAAAEARIDFATLRNLRPGIVVVAITPFGCTGPYADRPASDLTVFALSGHLYLTGLAEREPLLPYGHQPDLFGGLLGAEVALAGLLSSRQDGSPRFLEISEQEALASALDTTLNRYSYLGAERSRYGNRLQDETPLTDIYRTKDGYFLICVYTDAQWREFCAMLERPEWLDDAELRTLAGRLHKGAVIEAAMRAWFAMRTSREALLECQKRRLPSCIAASVRELLEDPQLLARGHFVVVEDPLAGRLKYPKLPYVFSAGASREEPAPRPDEHGAALRRSWTPRPPSADAAPSPALPLDGIRVLDVTHAWAGPFSGLQLGFLGAELIKVEGGRRPDGTRYVSLDARNLSPTYETGGYFHEWNRNKRSAVINMDAPEGRELMHALVLHSDVLINNFSARVLPKWGLDWAAVKSINPRVVLVTMPAFGSQGPYREFVGYGETLEGAGGLARLSGYEPGVPIRGGTAYPDPLVGHYGALAVTLGLMRRAQTGSGLWIDLSHQECVLHMIGEAVLNYQLSGTPEEPGGNARPDLLLNEVLPCAGIDDWIAISIASPAQWRAVAELIGASPLETPLSRPEALDRLRSWTKARSKGAAMEALAARGVPAGAVLKVDELFRDAHLAARGFFEQIPHPVVGEKPHPRPGFSIRGAEVRTRTSAPLFDSATDDVLRSILGKSDDEIAHLRARGVVGGMPAGSPLPS